MYPYFLLLLILLGCAAATSEAPRAGAGAPAARQRADSGAFVVRLGNDTLVLERFTRTGDTVTAEALIRSPATVLRRYRLALNDSGGIARYEAIDVATGGDVGRRETLTRTGDSAVHVIAIGDSVREARFPLPAGALPFLNLVQWPNELVVGRVGPAPNDSVIIPYLTGRNVTHFVVRRVSADSVTIRHPTRGVSRVHVGPNGQLLHLDAGATTLKLDVRREPWLPLEQLAPAIAARDAARPRSELSPRGETAVTVDGATITVNYGRPSKRGREIFGKVVPYGQDWRTGANQATQFSTDRDLTIAGRTLPAVDYSIFSIPGAGEWAIIINGETRQAGTAHDPARDIMRVPTATRGLRETVEQFTILVEDTSEGGVIRFQWDDREAVMAFTVR